MFFKYTPTVYYSLCIIFMSPFLPLCPDKPHPSGHRLKSKSCVLTRVGTNAATLLEGNWRKAKSCLDMAERNEWWMGEIIVIKTDEERDLSISQRLKKREIKSSATGVWQPSYRSIFLIIFVSFIHSLIRSLIRSFVRSSIVYSFWFEDKVKGWRGEQ